MTEEYRPRSPVPLILTALMLIGGGWYFLQHYQVAGLDGITIREKSAADTPGDLLDPGSEFIVHTSGPASAIGDGINGTNSAATPPPRPATAIKVRNLRIATWALSDFSLSNLSEATTRENLIRIVRQFDLIACQQLADRERDLLPRLVDVVNGGDPRYEYLLGDATGPADQRERLAVVFDKSRLQIDRTQSYELADPENRMTYDPLVAWFRARGPSIDSAWTFSLVNIRIDLARAPEEVDLLPYVSSAVRFDGRGEDDVVLAGLFQADDAYLLAKLGDADAHAAVRNTPTDILGQHQTSNLLMNTKVTSEYSGRGGTFDFLRTFNLSIEEAASLSTQLPVYAEFTATEGRDF